MCLDFDAAVCVVYIEGLFSVARLEATSSIVNVCLGGYSFPLTGADGQSLSVSEQIVKADEAWRNVTLGILGEKVCL